MGGVGVKWWWLSSRAMTVAVQTRNGIITEAPPIARRFIGRPAGALESWMRRQGGFRWATLDG